MSSRAKPRRSAKTDTNLEPRYCTRREHMRTYPQTEYINEPKPKMGRGVGEGYYQVSRLSHGEPDSNHENNIRRINTMMRRGDVKRKTSESREFGSSAH